MVADSDSTVESVPVDAGRFVPPALVQSTPVQGTVTDEQTVDIEWDANFTLSLSDPLEPGTEVKVVRSGEGFAAKPIDQIEAAQEAKAWERERQKIHGQARKRRQRVAFWEQYDIPIAFTTAKNNRISELRRGSTGTGQTENTVTHLLVLEDVDEGRLKRAESRFLCKGEGNRSDQRMGLADQTAATDPKETSVIDCQTCLERMKRWRVDDRRK